MSSNPPGFIPGYHLPGTLVPGGYAVEQQRLRRENPLPPLPPPSPSSQYVTEGQRPYSEAELARAGARHNGPDSPAAASWRRNNSKLVLAEIVRQLRAGGVRPTRMSYSTEVHKVLDRSGKRPRSISKAEWAILATTIHTNHDGPWVYSAAIGYRVQPDGVVMKGGMPSPGNPFPVGTPERVDDRLLSLTDFEKIVAGLVALGEGRGMTVTLPSGPGDLVAS